MGKQSRLRKARKVVKRKGGLEDSALALLKPGEAFGMNAHTGKISIRPLR